MLSKGIFKEGAKSSFSSRTDNLSGNRLGYRFSEILDISSVFLSGGVHDQKSGPGVARAPNVGSVVEVLSG
jgi:hypothetical protein